MNNARSCIFYQKVIVDNASRDVYVIHRIAVDCAAVEHCGLDEILSDNSCAGSEVSCFDGFVWQQKNTSSHIIVIVSCKRMSDKHLGKGKYILYLRHSYLCNIIMFRNNMKLFFVSSLFIRVTLYH